MRLESESMFKSILIDHFKNNRGACERLNYSIYSKAGIKRFGKKIEEYMKGRVSRTVTVEDAILVLNEIGLELHVKEKEESDVSDAS